MPPLYRPAFRYTDPDLTPPAPGRALVLQVGLVESVPGVGPKTGGRYVGVVRAVGPARTRLWRPHDQVEMSLPNEQLQPVTSSFVVAGHRAGVFDLADRSGWEWLRWTVADHLTHDHTTSSNAAGGVEGGSGPLVVIPCGASKRADPTRAGAMYTSGVHRLAQRAAHALTSTDRIRILSARHGLLHLDDVITPYELRLGDPGSITSDHLRAQADQQGLLEHPEVIVLAGRDYTRLVCDVFPHAATPLAGSRGIGDHQHRLARIATGTPIHAFTP